MCPVHHDSTETADPLLGVLNHSPIENANPVFCHSLRSASVKNLTSMVPKLVTWILRQ